MANEISRRMFLVGGGAASLALQSKTASHIAALSGILPSQSNPSLERMRYQEAPMLAKQVAAGKLPPVEQRLPKHPFVRQVQQIGKYGGTLHDQASSPGGRFHLDGTLIVGAQETDNGGEIIRPHLCDQVSFNSDYTEFTFHIRDGLKWSDGVDVTADDVLFWWKYEQWNRMIWPDGPQSFKMGDDYADFSKADRQTFRITFPAPFRPCLNLSISEWMSFGNYFGQPSHWMKQFHIDFNPKADELAREKGFGSWYQYYRIMLMEYMHPAVGKPHLGPWYRAVSTTTHDIYERNPYFAEVDQEGNQLPYIDRIFVQVVEDQSLQVARRATGGVSEGLCEMSQISVFSSNAERAGYEIKHWWLADSSECMFAFNLNHRDPIKRRVYNNLKFRQALSYAINRHRINQTLYFGQAKEWQATVSPKVSFFDPSWIEYCSRYDPDEANRLLDEAGLRWDNDRRVRLGPDGKRFVSVVIYNQQAFPVELLEFVRQDWSHVGIEVIMKQTDFRYREWTCRAGNQDATCWNGDMVEEVAIYLPWSTKWNPQQVLFYAMDWWLWYATKGRSGIEPPLEWKEQFKRMEMWYRAKSDEDYRRLGRSVWDFFTQQLVCIGTVGYAPQPVVIKKGLQNVMDSLHIGYGTGWAKSYMVQSYFWDEPEKHE
jgi:peptide/nickel transport system substrate-binding protein